MMCRKSQRRRGVQKGREVRRGSEEGFRRAEERRGQRCEEREARVSPVYKPKGRCCSRRALAGHQRLHQLTFGQNAKLYFDNHPI